MPIKSKDVIKAELHQKFSAALTGEDPAAITDALTDFACGIQQDVLDDFKAYQQTQDASILATRGIRQLTAEERNFYSNWGNAAKADNPKMAFTGLDSTTLPMTIIDTVLDDIGSAFPLLKAINFQNTSTITRMIVNKQGKQFATWGALQSTIADELSGALGVIDVGTNKLTAFMAVSRDMIDAGPEWMDAYVRTVLVEALGFGLCLGIVAGTGNNAPIGMLKDINGAVTNGVYPDKATVAITDLNAKTIGGIAATLAQGPTGRKRAVPEILVVVNPVDYFTKVMPATTFMTASGTYANNVLPYPSNIVQDENVPSGKAIFGLASRYFMGVGKGGSGGQIEYSDEFRFLDDQRVYKIKLYGNGQPLDGNAFVIADISGLKELAIKVNVGTVDGVVKTKEQTT
jgi:hypothetical protein